MAPNTRKRASSVASSENRLKGRTRSTKKQRKLEPEKSVETSLRNESSKESEKPCSSRSSCSSKNKLSFVEKKVSAKEKEKLTRRFENDKEKQKNSVEADDINNLDVAQLLALGESQNSNMEVELENSFEDSSESDVSDFEEVKNAEFADPVIPKEGVDITLEMPNLSYRHKKKGLDLEMHLKRQLNRVKKDLQLLMHKVHVLGWIAHIKYVNNVVNSPFLMKSCAVLIKSKNLYPAKHSDLSYLEGILKWFHKNFELRKNIENSSCTGGLLKELLHQFEKKQAFSSKVFVLMFIILLRVLGLDARIVMSFQVIPIKPPTSELYKNNASVENVKSVAQDEASSSKNELKKFKSPEKDCDNSNCHSTTIKKNVKAKQKRSSGFKNDESSEDECFESSHFKPSINFEKEKDLSKRRKKEKINEPKVKKKKNIKKVKNGKVLDFDYVNSDEDEDDDFTVKSLKKTENKKKPEKKSLTVSDDCLESKKKENLDLWAEVYVEAEEKWISVDVARQKIHCIGEIYSRATHPVVYIIACNNDQTLKDITKRYVPNWHSDTRKRRVDEEWWNETMQPYLPPKTARDKMEDEDIEKQLTDKPLPATISEYKDHPLYALKRHLLKFEAIYPPNALTLGFVRGEPVYGRECVVTLRSREIWYKEARVVRLKEEPYKIVKARPKYDRMTGEIKKDLPLELFGIWQTEEYIPPVASDGKVPRNEYGNVDLFKPCMLPIGTVHLQIPGLIRVAKKLGIDCAPATVGFEFHSGGSHPIFDGVVVCEEFKETLLDHWNKEIDESAKRNEERKEKRVYGNWKHLIRGLLIKEKLKIKYAFGENSDEEGPASSFLASST